MNIYCMQKTKWEREKLREFGQGYKIKYSGKTSTKNEVGVRVDK